MPYVVHISYIPCQYGNVHSPHFVKSVQVAHAKIFRFIFYKKKVDSTQDVLYTHKFLNIFSIHKYFLSLHIYKCLTHLSETQYFQVVRTLHNNRSNKVNFISPQSRAVLCNNSMFCVGHCIWNCLQGDIKYLVNFGNLSQFKRSLKCILLSLLYYICWKLIVSF